MTRGMSDIVDRGFGEHKRSPWRNMTRQLDRWMDGSRDTTTWNSCSFVKWFGIPLLHTRRRQFRSTYYIWDPLILHHKSFDDLLSSLSVTMGKSSANPVEGYRNLNNPREMKWFKRRRRRRIAAKQRLFFHENVTETLISSLLRTENSSTFSCLTSNVTELWTQKHIPPNSDPGKFDFDSPIKWEAAIQKAKSK